MLVNIGYRPFDRMDLLLGYIWGERHNKDGQMGCADRKQLGADYGF